MVEYDDLTQEKKVTTLDKFFHAMKNGTVTKIKKCSNRAVKLVYLAIALIGISAVYNLFTSELSGQFAIYEKDEKTGKTEILRFKVMKSAPPEPKINNLMELGYGTDGTRSIQYKRKVFKLGPFNTYMGGGLTLDKEGQLGGKAGVTIGF